MSFGDVPVKFGRTFAGVLWLTAGIWIVRGYVWPQLSNVEVAALQAMIDPSLFRHDFAVQEYLRFTPRYYWDHLILLPVRVGVPLAWSFALWHTIMLALLLSAVQAIARELKLGAIAFSALGTWMLFVSAGTIAGVYFYTQAPVPAVWAGAVAAWGAVFALRQRPLPAYACFGAAVLLQFLVGFYAGLLALPVLWRRSGRDRVLALGFWALALALVYGPMRWANGTGTNVLDDATFVWIYAQLRLPHHLVPSTWGWPAWTQLVAFYVGAGFFFGRTKPAFPAERRMLAWTLAWVVGLLVLNYLFVEWRPLALVAKLQPARITPLAQLVVLGVLAGRVEAAIANRKWLEAVLLAAIPLSSIPGFLFILAAILLAPSTSTGATNSPWPAWVLAAAVALAFQPFATSLARHALHFAPWIGVFSIFALAAWLEAKPRLAALAGTLATIAAVACAYASSNPVWPSRLAQHFSIDLPPFDATGRLGERFGRSSDPDATVLVPPFADAWTFKLYARRAVVVDAKNTPFTDSGLREWHRRMEDVLGARLTPALDREAAWCARSAADLTGIAAKYHAKYVLTRDAWQPRLAARRIDGENGWSLWELP